MTMKRPGARLPEDPAYWDDLAARSINAAFRGAPAGASATAAGVQPWWRGLADSAYMLAASALLALVGGSLLLDERPTRAMPEAGALAGALAPDDALLRTLLNTPGEPTSLLQLIALREEEQ